MESDNRTCESLSDKHDLQVINGSGSSPQVMIDAGIAGADLVLAVTPNNEVNLIVCAIARQHDVPQRDRPAARPRTPQAEPPL